MRTPSRKMPPGPLVGSSVTGFVLGCGCVGLIVGVGLLSFGVIGASLILGLLVLFNVSEHRRLARLAADRRHESICTFARSFPRRSIDTWVIRAVHEGFQPYCRAYGGLTLPLRATDRIDEDLRIDPDDVDDLADEIAVRTGRSLDDAEMNPYYGRVETIADFAAFIDRQPFTAAGLAMRPYLGGSQ